MQHVHPWWLRYIAPAAGPQLLSQLAARACACLDQFAPQHVSVLLWAYAKLDTSPGFNLLSGAAGAASAAMVRFNPQNMANTLWAYATLGHYPGAALLDAAAERQLALIQVPPARSVVLITGCCWAAVTS